MQKKTDNIRIKLSGFCSKAVVAITLLFMCYLLPMSFFRTTDMSTGDGKGEVVSFAYDNFFLNLIMLFISICLLYLAWTYFQSHSVNTLLVILSGWVLFFGLILIVSTKLQPSEDSYIVNFFARQAARGDFSYYHEYFRFFPFQFGYVLYAEIIFRIFNMLLPGAPEGFASLTLQGLNLVYTIISYWALVKFSGYVFKSESAQKLTAMLLFLCFPALYFVTFMYGNVPSFACACIGLWAYAAFMEDGRWYKGLAAIFLFTLSVMLKLNSLIIVVAVLIAAFVSFVKKPRVLTAIFAVVLALSVFNTMDLPKRFYEKRMGEDLGDGIPIISWFAMGIHEGESCSGWYNPTYTTTAYIVTVYDAEATAEIAQRAIDKRLGYFLNNLEECQHFFGRKFLSQWNEPSYQGLWNNQLRDHYSDPGLFYELFCHRFERGVKAFMNVFQQLVFFGFTLGLLRMFKKRDINMALLPLVILGGMLYHLLFEAKSQHSQGYFIMMIPIAAYGFVKYFEYLRANKAQ